MSWFDRLVGFQESNPEQVRENLVLDGTRITSLANGRVMNCGTLGIPSLAELRSRVRSIATGDTKISLREVVGNVRTMHGEPQNANAMFQVASQFNLLEMTSPHVTPERGIGIYENDLTQGPACAIAAGAGTIYRNYSYRSMDESDKQPTIKWIALKTSELCWVTMGTVCGG